MSWVVYLLTNSVSDLFKASTPLIHLATSLSENIVCQINSFTSLKPKTSINNFLDCNSTIMDCNTVVLFHTVIYSYIHTATYSTYIQLHTVLLYTATVRDGTITVCINFYHFGRLSVRERRKKANQLMFGRKFLLPNLALKTFRSTQASCKWKGEN